MSLSSSTPMRARSLAGASAQTGFVLDALEQAIHDRKPTKAKCLVHHSDRGSQYLSIRYTERLGEAGIEPSVGSVVDSYDCSMVLLLDGLTHATIDWVSLR